MTGYTDLRRSIDGLAEIVQGQLYLNPFSKALFLFCGRRRDSIERRNTEPQQQMAWLKKQMLGRKTEQTSTIMDGGTQLSLFGDAQPESAPVQEETVTVPEQDRRMRSKKICLALFNWAWKGVFY